MVQSLVAGPNMATRPYPRGISRLAYGIISKPPVPVPPSLDRDLAHVKPPLPLSEREQQVLSMVAEGYSNKTIADQLAISERTVKNHVTNVLVKLQASCRTHAVVTAVRQGWLIL